MNNYILNQIGLTNEGTEHAGVEMCKAQFSLTISFGKLRAM